MQEGIFNDNFEGHTCPGCKSLRTRLAEVEAQRDGLKDAMIRICDTVDDERGNAWELCDIAREARAKLEEK